MIMDVTKIEVMTPAGKVCFHVRADKPVWVRDEEGMIIFTKLSNKDISFVQSNVIYINEIAVVDNSGGDSVE